MVKKKKEIPKYSFLQSDFEADIIRCVEPYVFDYTTFAKGRWLKRSLIDVLTKEFGGYEVSYWHRVISSGLVTVNNKYTTPDYVIQNSDRIVHRTHRHEPPVKGTITLVGQTEDLMAVSKPASMPMHPCGGYRYNSLSFILAHEPFSPDQPELCGVHRLDRVTSGLVIIAKNKQTAAIVSKEIRENSTQKTYLARVKGRLGASLEHLVALQDEHLFAPTESAEIITAIAQSAAGSGSVDHGDKKRAPPDETRGETSTKKIKSDEGSKAAGGSSDNSPSSVDAVKEHIGYGWRGISEEKMESRGAAGREEADISRTHDLVVRCPLGVASFKEGIHRCDINGKPALSTFRFVSYNEADDTSIVRCQPHTGRTHQLRLHLQLIGNPIANDPCYGGELFYGEPAKLAKAKEAAARLCARGGRTLSKLPHILHILPADQAGADQGSGHTDKCSSDSDGKDEGTAESLAEEDGGLTRRAEESEEEFLIRNCRYCQDRTSPDLTEEMLLHCDGIWLHALRYCGKDWQFETELPRWARS